MRTTNYPNHPLFRIAPLLDKGVMHDEYVSRLIGRICAGRYMPELWDCNSLYLGYAERLGSPAYQQQVAIKSRYEMTPQEIAAQRADPAWIEEKARIKAEQQARRAERKAKIEAEETKLAAVRRAMAEERERFAQEYAAAQAKREADWKQRDREWAEWPKEQAAILAGPWECTQCLKPSQISLAPAARYAISCGICGRRIVADHATLVNVLAVHQTRLETASPG